MAVEHQQHTEQTTENKRPQQVEPDVAPQMPELLPLVRLPQVMAKPATASPAEARAMQRTVGNQVTSRVIVAQREQEVVQAKLTVGPADDEYEQEADRVANRVVQMNTDDLQRQEEEEELQLKPTAGIQAQVEEEEELVQGKAMTDIRLQRQEEEEELQLKPVAQARVQRVSDAEVLTALQILNPNAQLSDLQNLNLTASGKAGIAGWSQRVDDMADRPTSTLIRNEPGIPGNPEVWHNVWLKPLSGLLPSLQAQEEDEELQMKPVLAQRQSPEEEELAQTKPIAGPAIAQRQPTEEEELQLKPALQRREIRTKSGDDGGFTVDGDLEQRILQKKGSGRRLPADVQADMESRFGADFSGVRVHTDGESAQVSKSLHARAFTHGHDIFFNSGEASFNSTEGKRLLAHELTHVIQQMGFGKKKREGR